MTTTVPIQQTFDFDLPTRLKPGEVVLNCSVCGTPYIFHSFKNVVEGEEFVNACCREHWVKHFCNVWKGADYLFFKNLCKINEITDDEVLRATS